MPIMLMLTVIRSILLYDEHEPGDGNGVTLESGRYDNDGQNSKPVQST